MYGHAKDWPVLGCTYQLAHARYPGAHCRILNSAGDGYFKVMVRTSGPSVEPFYYDSHVSIVHRTVIGALVSNP